MRTHLLVAAALALACAGCSAERIPLSATGPDRAPIVMAFLSERPPSPIFSTDIYLYDLRTGEPAYLAPNLNTPDLEGPCAISGDGRKVAFYTLRFPAGSTAVLLLYDVAHATTTVPDKINQLGTLLQNPSLSGDGRYLAVQYQVGGPFEQYIAIEDLATDSLLPVPHLNDPTALNFDPSLNGDGSLIAFASNRFGSGSYDIFLYSVPGDSLIPLPGLNSPAGDLAASISGDGRYLAFQSTRPVGSAPNDSLIDVYVYDRVTASLLPLPGANTPMAEILPSISPDGRYLAYTTELTGGRDVRVYDIRERRLLKLEGLNDPYYRDYFPSLASP